MPDANSWNALSFSMYEVPYVNRKAGTITAQGTATEPIPPVISNVTPAPNAVIGPFQVLSFDVTDEEDSFRRIIIVAEFPSYQIKEVVFDGDGFGPMYTNGYNQQTAIVNGYTFSLLRNGGWPEAPSLTPFALDTSGAENA